MKKNWKYRAAEATFFDYSDVNVKYWKFGKLELETGKLDFTDNYTTGLQRRCTATEFDELLWSHTTHKTPAWKILKRRN